MILFRAGTFEARTAIAIFFASKLMMDNRKERFKITKNKNISCDLDATKFFWKNFNRNRKCQFFGNRAKLSKKNFTKQLFLKFRRHKRLAQINFRKILRVKTTLTSLNWTLIPQWVALLHETLYTCEEKWEAVSSVLRSWFGWKAIELFCRKIFFIDKPKKPTATSVTTTVNHWMKKKWQKTSKKMF